MDLAAAEYYLRAVETEKKREKCDNVRLKNAELALMFKPFAKLFAPLGFGYLHFVSLLK